MGCTQFNSLVPLLVRLTTERYSAVVIEACFRLAVCMHMKSDEVSGGLATNTFVPVLVPHRAGR
jgi:hypothetical protein